MTSRTRQSALVVLAITAFGLVTGCSTVRFVVTQPQSPLPANESSALFLDRISNQQNVSENDAMRGLLLLLDGKDDSAGFQQRAETLIARKIAGDGWSFHPDRSITRGKLAYMLCQACDIKDSVMLTLTGPSQRYCLRELQNKGFFNSGVLYTQVSGMEFVAALTRADIYLETGNVPRIISTNRY